MPRQTFFNLPEEKRKAILETAIDEFSKYDYQSTSISRMVARLGIAKGSFYQYFEDKQDLYFYVLEQAMRERLAFAAQYSLTKGRSGFFENVRDLLESGLRYDLSHPRNGKIIYRAMFGKGPFREKSLDYLRAPLLEYQRQVLRNGMKAGAIAPDIDLDLAAHILNAVMADFGSYIVNNLGLDPERLLQGAYTESELDALRTTLTHAVRILQYGIGQHGE